MPNEDYEAYIQAPCAGLFLSGPYRHKKAGRFLLKIPSCLSAADGGARHLLALGLSPASITGDLDSLSPELQEQARTLGIPAEKYPREKDETDGQLAVEKLIREGYKTIILFAAFGGQREDHALSMLNFCLEKRKAEGLRFIFTDGESVIFPLSGPERLKINSEDYFSQKDFPDLRISGVPLTAVRGLTLDGLKYEVSGLDLPAGTTRLVSNEPAASGRFSVTFESGDLILFMLKEEKPSSEG